MYYAARAYLCGVRFFPLQIFLHWAEYKMTTPRDCVDSYLAFYDRTTNPSDRQGVYCRAKSNSGGGDRRTASNVAYLRLYAANVDLIPHFRVVFTPFLFGENMNFIVHVDVRIDKLDQTSGPS